VLAALPVTLLRHLAALFRRVPDTGHADMAGGRSRGVLVADGILAIIFATSLCIPLRGGLEGVALIGVFLLAGCGLGMLGALYYARVDFNAAAERAKLHGATDDSDLAARHSGDS
jgi:hypothetical protein